MKTTLLAIAFFWLTCSVAAQSWPRFADYPARIYTGPIHRPKWIRHVTGAEWRDDIDKLVIPPEVNFAGQYFVSVHSCGTFCRYYTMTDLSSGRELELLKDFAAGEPTPKTRDGYPYITDLETRANSKLLVAHYLIQAPHGDDCRERAFVLNNGKITPVTGTRRTACPN